MSSISFSISSKQQSSRFKKPPRPSDSSTRNYLTEFSTGEKPPPVTEVKTIAPLPNQFRYNKRLKNLTNIQELSQTGDASLQFELYDGSNADESDGSMSFGLNVRQAVDKTAVATEKFQDLELRMLREDLQMLPDHMGMEEFNVMPVEEFATSLLRGYGWKEGMGIGRNAKEDVKVAELFKKKVGRGGLGFSDNDHNIGEKTGEGNSEVINQKEDKGFGVEKEVRIGDVSKRGMKPKDSRKMGPEDKTSRNMKSNWLRNHIRVRIISKELKKGRLYLKKGVVVDVVQPGVCDISMDDSRELLQQVDQDFLETALPKHGGPVLILYGRHEGVYGNLVERDLEKETGIVQDADTQELLNVKLDQIAEYAGDTSHFSY